MAQREREHLKWVKAADSAAAVGDYEAAATYLRRVADHLWLIGEQDGFKVFAGKACACYLKAAEAFWTVNERMKASSLYRSVVNYLREVGNTSAAEGYDSLVQKYYSALVEADFVDFKGQAQDLKHVGDYFRARDNYVDAGKCYGRAAEIAVKEGKTMLAGGLYRDAGDCYRRIEWYERAVEAYEKAADNYFQGEGYYEAAWYYNVCGFMVVSVRKLDKASTLAGKAQEACVKGNIGIFISDLSLICKSLSEGRILEAREQWSKIRRKFRETYVNLVESSFKALT